MFSNDAVPFSPLFCGCVVITIAPLYPARWFPGPVTELALQRRLSDPAREGAAVCVLHGQWPGGQVKLTNTQVSRITGFQFCSLCWECVTVMTKRLEGNTPPPSCTCRAIDSCQVLRALSAGYWSTPFLVKLNMYGKPALTFLLRDIESTNITFWMTKCIQKHSFQTLWEDSGLHSFIDFTVHLVVSILY